MAYPEKKILSVVPRGILGLSRTVVNGAVSSRKSGLKLEPLWPLKLPVIGCYSVLRSRNLTFFSG